MTGLQEAFYIIGIVYMAIMLIIALSLVVTLFVIRAKINKIHDNLEAKLDFVAGFAGKSGELAAVVSAAAVRKAKKALSRK